MSLKSVKILGIPVTTDSKKNILEYIEKYLEKSLEKRGKPFVIVTPNPEQIVCAQEDPHFAKILNKADVALPDGIGLAIAIKRTRIPGVEFMEDLIRLASERGYTIGLIGGRAGVAVETLECLKAGYPELKGWAEEPGEMTIRQIRQMPQIRQMIHKIQKTNTKMVFVGLGAPKQEYLIEQLASQDTLLRTQESVLPLVLMSVGGSFDLIAGRLRRAPWIVRSMGLEWFWRLGREPWRWRRQVALLKFLWLVIEEKLASKGQMPSRS